MIFSGIFYSIYIGILMKTFIALLLFSKSVLAASLYAPNGTYLGEVGGNPKHIATHEMKETPIPL